MIAIGWGCIVLGGLFAAVTGPLELVEGSWLAAYLVLVAGVAQVAMGSAQRVHHAGAPSHAALSGTRSFVQLLAWNGGNVAVVGGTLIGETLLVDLGSLLLIVALVLALLAARSAVVDGGADAISRDGVGRRMPEVVLCAYRGLLLVLVVSIPIGIVLSHARHN